ncbi:unnamed protein product [Effrenium voratum]|nr:unnamed protein product [Effrenium voratum]
MIGSAYRERQRRRATPLQPKACHTPEVLLPWRAEVNAIASIFMGGVATGAAWASFLFGDSPPRGRLPIMMPATAADTIPVGDVEVDYSEGLLTSYRSPRLKAAYPFGHGLTFTSFEFSGAKQLACPNVACVSVGIKNLGHGSGEEVVQAYVHFPSPQGGDDRWVQSTPAMVLKKFQRTKVLQPNESQLLRLDFSPEDFSLFSSERGCLGAAVQGGGVAGSIQPGHPRQGAHRGFQLSREPLEVAEISGADLQFAESAWGPSVFGPTWPGFQTFGRRAQSAASFGG